MQRSDSNCLQEYFSGGEIFLLVINFIALIVALPGTILLLINEIYYVVNNMTRIELWTRHWANYDAKEKGQVSDENSSILTAQTYRYPYDRGTFNNLKEVFGSYIALWWLPVPVTPPKNPLDYPDLVPARSSSTATPEEVV